MNKFLKILGVILVVAGSILACFTSIAVASYVSIAVAALGLALTITSVWKEAEKATWKEVVAIVCFALGGLLCGFVGFTESVVSQLIITIGGVISLILGMFMTFKKS